MNIKKIIQRAEQKLMQNNLIEARELLIKALNINNSNVDVLNKLAFISFKLNAINDAKSFLEKLVLIAHNPEAEKNLLMIYLKSKEWENAKKLIEKIQIKDPKNYLLNKNYAYVMGKLEYFDSANILYKELISKNAGDTDLYINYGYLLNLQKKYNEAIKIYQQGLNHEKDNYHLHYNIGVSYKNIRKFEESIVNFKKALSINNRDYQIWLTMAGSMLEILNVDEAVDALDHAAEINSNNPELFFQRAILKQTQGHYDESIELLKKALYLDKNHIMANQQLGLMYLKMGKYIEGANHKRYRILDNSRCVLDFNVNEIEKNKDVLVVWEEGVGDTLVYIRALSGLSEIAKSITVVVQDKLYQYIKNNYPEYTILKDSDIKNIRNDEKYNSYIKINFASLLRFVEAPEKLSYIEKKHVSNRDKIDLYRNEKFKIKKEKRIVGLSWKSITDEILHEHKSYTLSMLTGVFENRENYLVNLQYGEINKELKSVKQKFNREIYIDTDLNYYDDFVGLSNLIASCDVVITCSNVTAHLAGALHIETYLLLSKESGVIWYWYPDDTKSRWYPTVNIIRQEEQGNWSKVYEKINEILG
jgi:tetratricopeptide (TPR) repeat protein